MEFLKSYSLTPPASHDSVDEYLCKLFGKYENRWVYEEISDNGHWRVKYWKRRWWKREMIKWKYISKIYLKNNLGCTWLLRIKSGQSKILF